MGQVKMNILYCVILKCHIVCYSATAAVECDQGATPVIVPILVGSALGLFVIILLLAYVIGRLRQRRARSGYSRL